MLDKTFPPKVPDAPGLDRKPLDPGKPGPQTQDSPGPPPPPPPPHQ